MNEVIAYNNTEALGTAAASLLSQPSLDLHHIVGSPSACPVIGLFLRVLFAPAIIQVPSSTKQFISALRCTEVCPS